MGFIGSTAITRSAKLSNIRVCELAVATGESRRRRIDEMEWLIADIRENGEVRTLPELEDRPVPDFAASADRACAAD